MPMKVEATIVVACLRRIERFWTDTAAEYTSAKALSVSSTRIAINGRALRPKRPSVARNAMGTCGFNPNAVMPRNTKAAPRR